MVKNRMGAFLIGIFNFRRKLKPIKFGLSRFPLLFIRNAHTHLNEAFSVGIWASLQQLLQVPAYPLIPRLVVVFACVSPVSLADFARILIYVSVRPFVYVAFFVGAGGKRTV